MTTANTHIRGRSAAAWEEMRQTYLGALAAMLESKRRRDRYRRTIRELASLPDRDLRDIGINRSDIPRIALKESRKD